MRQKRIKRRVIIAGKWYRKSLSLYEGCCDCGLVHYVEYRIKGKKLWSRCWRSPKTTERARKQFKHPHA